MTQHHSSSPSSPATTKEERGSKRPETGPMQFGDDWPGVFIRGDNAGAYAMALEMMLNPPAHPIVEVQVRSLIRLLASSDVRQKPEVQHAVLAPPLPDETRGA